MADQGNLSGDINLIRSAIFFAFCEFSNPAVEKPGLIRRAIRSV